VVLVFLRELTELIVLVTDLIHDGTRAASRAVVTGDGPTADAPAPAAYRDSRDVPGGIRGVIKTVDELQTLVIAGEAGAAGSMLILEKLGELPDSWV
jgi:hypothetical protein